MSSPLFARSKKKTADINNVEFAFNLLLATLEQVCQEGREFAIVKTKLEEASMYAKKALKTDKEKS